MAAPTVGMKQSSALTPYKLFTSVQHTNNGTGCDVATSSRHSCGGKQCAEAALGEFCRSLFWLRQDCCGLGRCLHRQVLLDLWAATMLRAQRPPMRSRVR